MEHINNYSTTVTKCQNIMYSNKQTNKISPLLIPVGVGEFSFDVFAGFSDFNECSSSKRISKSCSFITSASDVDCMNINKKF